MSAICSRLLDIPPATSDSARSRMNRMYGVVRVVAFLAASTFSAIAAFVGGYTSVILAGKAVWLYATGGAFVDAQLLAISVTACCVGLAMIFIKRHVDVAAYIVRTNHLLDGRDPSSSSSWISDHIIPSIVHTRTSVGAFPTYEALRESDARLVPYYFSEAVDRREETFIRAAIADENSHLPVLSSSQREWVVSLYLGSDFPRPNLSTENPLDLLRCPTEPGGAFMQNPVFVQGWGTYEREDLPFVPPQLVTPDAAMQRIIETVLERGDGQMTSGDIDCPVFCEPYEDSIILPCGDTFSREALQRHFNDYTNQTDRCISCQQPAPEQMWSSHITLNALSSLLLTSVEEV